MSDQSKQGKVFVLFEREMTVKETCKLTGYEKRYVEKKYAYFQKVKAAGEAAYQKQLENAKIKDISFDSKNVGFSNFILLTNNSAVKIAYDKMVNPKKLMLEEKFKNY